jgi:hypothetical protein
MIPKGEGSSLFIESKRKRRQKHRLATTGVCILVLGMAMYGYNASRQEQRQQARQSPTPTGIVMATPNIPVVVQQEPVIEANTEVVLITRYLGCNHERRSNVANALVLGLTQKQLQALYPLCAIASFSHSKVELRREIEGVCPSHFVVKLEDKVLAIYQREDDDSWRKVQTIEEFYLPYEDKSLREGIVFDNMHQIESFLENLEH